MQADEQKRSSDPPSDEKKSESAVPVPSELTPIRRSLEKVIEDNQNDLEKSES